MVPQHGPFSLHTMLEGPRLHITAFSTHMVRPLDESQGSSRLQGHGSWLMCEVALNTPHKRCMRHNGGQGQRQKNQSPGHPTLACPNHGMTPDPGMTLAFLKVACPYNPYWVHFIFKLKIQYICSLPLSN